MILPSLAVKCGIDSKAIVAKKGHSILRIKRCDLIKSKRHRVDT
jgi:hypothetical protein